MPTTEEFADMYEEYKHMDVKEIAKQLAAKPDRSMSDGAGYIGKAALAVFTNKDFKASREFKCFKNMIWNSEKCLIFKLFVEH